MSVMLDLMKGRQAELERAHSAFIEEPTEEHAWQLAAAVESLLDVMKEV